ncbi:major Facilitator Superfamily protein [Lysobacter capsici]|uniref:NTP/NDP exchange transporter n=1 Tax=Lysobacter capsici TaxID=435897 RepID=UPI0007166943|nr:MFS transporter [Lysobacter capsici]ALN84493.1 major Facilitator Superfamily protein [Lysobacter capsici]
MNQVAALSHRDRDPVASSAPLWWSLLYFFCLLCGYYVLRPVRDAMGASNDAATVFPHAMIAWAQAHGWQLKDFVLQVLFTATFVSMVLLQPVYGALVARFPRRVFLPVVYVVFIACLFGFHWAFDTAVPGRGMVFFVWIALFNLFAVTVFWSYMADVFDDAQARRVYGYIGAGGTAGAVIGPMLTQWLVQPLGVANLLLVSIGFLSVCVLCIVRLRPWAMARERRQGLASGEAAMGGSVWAGLKLVWQRPVLRAMAVTLFFSVGAATLLYNQQAAIAREFYPNAVAATAYFARIDSAVNVLAILTQLLLTRWLLNRHGVAPALLMPGLTLLLGFGVLLASPVPVMVAIVQVLQRGSEFALAKPARETLYTRMDRPSRYKGKAVIDTAVFRGTDLAFAWVHKGVALLGTQAVFAAGLLAALGMTAGAWSIVRAQRRLPSAHRSSELPSSDRSSEPQSARGES